MHLLDRLQALPDDWLQGLNNQLLLREIDRRRDILQGLADRPIVLIAESDALNFMAGFIAALSCPSIIVLGNPQWKPQEWRQVGDCLTPTLVWSDQTIADCFPGIIPQGLNPGDILIPTGGTAGQIRFAIHRCETLSASVEGFQQYFNLEKINACCVLPLYHVSGLMQVVRSLSSGGQLAIHPWKALSDGVFPDINPEEFFLSLVPTQLQRLLNDPELARFKTILLGGAPAWESLITAARSRCLPIAPTYGMTETASQIATLTPQDFLRGQTGCGQALPHIEITIRNEQGLALPRGKTGLVTVRGRSLMKGYFPAGKFAIDDLGYFDSVGNLHIVGRHSQKIITGGENVYPSEIEAVIRSTHLVEDVCVLGVPDETWGEMVVAVYVPRGIEPDLAAAIAPLMSNPKQPKRWIALEVLPRNAQGKIDRRQLQDLHFVAPNLRSRY
jgi:o-succinylbenzoate---CoA ligase